MGHGRPALPVDSGPRGFTSAAFPSRRLGQMGPVPQQVGHGGLLEGPRSGGAQRQACEEGSRGHRVKQEQEAAPKRGAEQQNQGKVLEDIVSKGKSPFQGDGRPCMEPPRAGPHPPSRTQWEPFSWRSPRALGTMIQLCQRDQRSDDRGCPPLGSHQETAVTRHISTGNHGRASFFGGEGCPGGLFHHPHHGLGKWHPSHPSRAFCRTGRKGRGLLLLPGDSVGATVQAEMTHPPPRLTAQPPHLLLF